MNADCKVNDDCKSETCICNANGKCERGRRPKKFTLGQVVGIAIGAGCGSAIVVAAIPVWFFNNRGTDTEGFINFMTGICLGCVCFVVVGLVVGLGVGFGIASDCCN